MKINGIFFIAWHKYEILFANMGKKESRESKIVALVDRGLEFSQFVLSQFRKTGESQVQSPA